MLRRLLSAVRDAEKAEEAIKNRIEQTISCREDTISVVLIGDVHVLVTENQLASFGFGDLSALSGELLELEENIEHLGAIAKEVENSVKYNREVLLDVENSPASIQGSGSIDDLMTERDFSWFSREGTSISTASSTMERELWRYKKKRYKLQRNIAIAFAVISLIGFVAFAMLHFLN